MSELAEPDFTVGESLFWLEYGSQTQKLVVYHGIENDRALVSFGFDADHQPRLWTAAFNELSRPRPPENQQPTKYDPPPPLPTIPIEERRQQLKEAFAELLKAKLAVRTAEGVCDKSLRHLTSCQDRLRSYIDLETVAVDELVSQLNGNIECSTHPGDHRWAEREQAKHQTDLAQQAYDKLARLLHVAKDQELDRINLVRQRSADVVGALLSRAIVELGEQERELAERRAILKAQVQFYPETLEGTPKPIPLSNEARIIISNPPADTNEPLGYDLRKQIKEDRLAPVAELFNKLVGGNVDCDIKS